MPTTRTKILIAAGAAIVIGSFLGGFIPQYQRASSLAAQLREAQSRAQSLEAGAGLAKVRDLASALFIETVNRNYGNATARASDLFNQVRSVASDPKAAEHRGTLDWILSQRDSVVVSLSTSDPTAQKQVQEILERALRMNGTPKGA